MNSRIWLSFISLMLVLCLLSCGKKSPPILHERSMPFMLGQLEAEWRDNMVLLKGRIIDAAGNRVTPGGISGCRIYHAAYAMEDPPCEDCPIQYRFVREISGDVVSSEGFSCQVQGIDNKGLHFFRVHLLDRQGAVGPASDAAKVRID